MTEKKNMENNQIVSKEKIKNFSLERDCLAGLLKYPEAIYELDGFLDENDFCSEVSSKVFSVIRHLLIDQGAKRLDSAILHFTLSQKGYTFPPQCNITDYISNLLKRSEELQYGTVLSLAKNIRLLSVRRDLFDAGTNIQKKMYEANDFSSLAQVVTAADELYFEAIQKFSSNEDMSILGEGFGADLNYRADHPIDHLGFSTGFQHYDDLIGHLRPDSFNFVSARGKAGKSILAVDIAAHVAKVEKYPVFYADTELTKDMVRTRFISHLSNVGYNLIETGKWKHNEEICARVEQAIAIFEKLPIVFFSMRACNVSQMISAARRFLFRYVKRNAEQEWNPCLLVWDYIKLDYYSDSTANNPWYDMARSVVHFKDFLGSTKTAAMVFGQSNRSGVAKKNKDGTLVNEDNETTVAGTDEILKSASNVSQLRWKTSDEVLRDGEKAGDFMLLPYVCRTGRGGSWVQLADGALEREYVCLKRRAPENTFDEITTNKIIREQQSITHAVQAKPTSPTS